MPDFFCGDAAEGLALLSEEDSRHALRVLRLKPGDAVRVILSGHRFLGRLDVLEGRAAVRLGEPLPGSEARTRITLYQGLPKGDKLDLIVRQATELGVHAIVPCLFARCVPRPESGVKRLERLNRIAREAAMQSGRALIPEVEEPLLFSDLPGRLSLHGQALVAYEAEQALSLRDAYCGAGEVALVIGPEGGFTPEEIREMPARPVTLGPRILRTETAGIAAAAMLLALANDF